MIGLPNFPAYNRIATLKAEVIHLWGELSRLPRENTISKTKVPEPPTFIGSENKMQLHDWLSQIALYCLMSGIIVDDYHDLVKQLSHYLIYFFLFL